MKQLKKSVLLITILLQFSLIYSEEFPYQVNKIRKMEDVVNSNQSSIKKIWENYIWNEVINREFPASYYISTVINYFLWILWFIAVLILLYWFSLVFTDKTDEWIKKWYKFIKMASIAIIVIWVSWLISMWFINIYAEHVS